MLIDHLDSYVSDQPAALTIGNFDGCHLGHQRLLAKTLDYAQTSGCRSVALTFFPRPEAWFRGGLDEPLLFSEAQKHRALMEFGLAGHIQQPFNDSFSRTTHDEFTTVYLRNRLKARAVVVGDNFRFGHKRLGDVEFLQGAGKRLGFEVFVIPAAQYNEEAISSTRIRAAVSAGNMPLAASLLGRPYVLEGQVVRGDQLGRKIGFPTANLEGIQQLLPPTGVYVAWLGVGENQALLANKPKKAFQAVVNIGIRPTVTGAGTMRVEAHALDADWAADELYGHTLSLFFLQRLREEKKFPGLEELKTQITGDINEAKRLFETIW